MERKFKPRADIEEVKATIYAYCSKHDITFAALSRLLGYNENYISHIMQEKRVPSVELWGTLKNRMEVKL